MNVHKNARLTPYGRERMVAQVTSGQAPKAISKTVGVCPRTVRKWVKRYQLEGIAGLRDRRSRPHRLFRPTPQAVVERIGALRRERRKACVAASVCSRIALAPANVQTISPTTDMFQFRKAQAKCRKAAVRRRGADGLSAAPARGCPSAPIE